MIVITGKNGYISTGLNKFLSERGYESTLISVRGKIGSDIFRNAGTVVHAAGIVHIKAEKRLYHEVNYELTKRLAETAKNSGVKHFVFISTMSVYGKKSGEINENTPLLPTTPYGRSKLLAEETIKKLADDSFKVTIVRPPIVYGKNCPGNYSRLSALVKKIPVFPLVDNKHSMIYADNLYNCIKKIIDEEITGIILPQNMEYVNTSILCAEIAKNCSKKLVLSRLLGRVVGFMSFVGIVKKVFGSLYYSSDLVFVNDIVDFEKSVELSEK